MRVLVIGARGQLARSLVATPKPAGLDLVAVGRPELDLSAPDTISRAVDRVAPVLIINTAAYTSVDKAESEPELAHAINAQGAGCVADVCDQHRVPLIHLSTDYVFDGGKLEPYCENDPTAPLSVYGRSKLEGERLVATHCPCHVILRTAWVYSPFAHNFVKTMLQLAQNRAEIAVVGDQIGSPTYAPHLAGAVLAVAHRILTNLTNAAPWGIYHAAGSGKASRCDLAREVFTQSKRFGGPTAQVRPVTTAECQTAARRPANSRLDCSKLARTFEVHLPDWRDGVRECVYLLTVDRADQDSDEGDRGAA